MAKRGVLKECGIAKSCAAVWNVVSSPHAVGLLVDFLRPGGTPAVARTSALTEAALLSADERAGTVVTLFFDDSLSMARCSGSGVAGVGPGIDSGGVGVADPRAGKDPVSGNCRRRDCGRIAMAQSAANRKVFRESAQSPARTRRANPAAIEGGIPSLLGIGAYGGLMRGISISRICDGRPHAGGAARLGSGAALLHSVCAGSSLPGARWACEHTGHRRSVRNSANRVRWLGSGDLLARGD